MAKTATAPITTPASVPVDRPEGLGVLVGDVDGVFVASAGSLEEG
jgi:hypothetical protein